MTNEELGLECIRDFRFNLKKLKQMIKNGEIVNKNNLNGPIYLDNVEVYGNIVCRLLERYLKPENKK